MCICMILNYVSTTSSAMSEDEEVNCQLNAADMPIKYDLFLLPCHACCSTYTCDIVVLMDGNYSYVPVARMRPEYVVFVVTSGPLAPEERRRHRLGSLTVYTVPICVDIYRDSWFKIMLLMTE